MSNSLLFDSLTLKIRDITTKSSLPSIYPSDTPRINGDISVCQNNKEILNKEGIYILTNEELISNIVGSPLTSSLIDYIVSKKRLPSLCLTHSKTGFVYNRFINAYYVSLKKIQKE